MSFIRQFLCLNKWIKILIIFILLLWCIVVFLFVSKLNEKDHTEKRLNQAINYFEQTKLRNFELKGLTDVNLRFGIIVIFIIYLLYIINISFLAIIITVRIKNIN